MPYTPSLFRKAIDLEPDNPEHYYSIGVIDWTQAYGPRMKLREKLGLKDDQPLIQSPECSALRVSNLALIKDGMDALTKAIQLHPDYDDAMAYMNLLYRERADIQCGDPARRSTDLQAADYWVDLTVGTKKSNAAKADH